MAKLTLFKDGTVGQNFINSNQSMKKWHTKLNSELTKDAYTYAMWQFSQWTQKTPDELLEAHQYSKDGYDTLDSVQKFIKEGVVHAIRTYRSGAKTEKIIKIGELSRRRRVLLYAAIKSFFICNRAALPAEKFSITENHTAQKAVETKSTYMPLAEARNTIAACKTPYREFFSCMLYGGCGAREVLLINTMWPNLKKELQNVKDPEQPVILRYNFRKSNEEQPYFTFVPAKLLLPFINSEMPWMIPVSWTGKKPFGMTMYRRIVRPSVPAATTSVAV